MHGEEPFAAAPRPDESPPYVVATAVTSSGREPRATSMRNLGTVATTAGVLGLLLGACVLGPLGVLVIASDTEPAVWLLGGLVALVPVSLAVVLLYVGRRIRKGSG